MPERKGPGKRRSRQSEPEARADVAILSFQHDAIGSGVSRRGQIRPGGRLVVQYDPARLPPAVEAAGADGGIICHVRFRPGDQTYSGQLSERAAAARVESGVLRPAPAAEFSVPANATSVELWFERRGATTSIGWDSRYGQNYTFVVVPEGLPVPEPSVAVRAEATLDPSKIRVVEDAARKEKAVIATAARRIRTGLVIRAVVPQALAPTDVWADIHVFDAADELIHTGSVNLHQQDSTSDDVVFTWQDDIYQGSGGGSGMGVWHRPDAHTIQYRLYCRVETVGDNPRAQIFTDHVLHQFEVPADEEVNARG